MEIVRVAGGDYDRYEALLLQREQLEKQADAFQREYTREFGGLMVEVFQVKVDCIALKKSIAFYVAARNRGETADPAGLAAYLAVHMAAYRQQLEELIAQRDAAQLSGRLLAPHEMGEIKRLYRRLAKLLHPDLSPLTREVPELAELFRQVQIAYHCNDLEELQELEVLINSTLKRCGIDRAQLVIPDLPRRILALEEKIQQILTTEPYLYKDLLADVFQMQEKREALQTELQTCLAYRAQLEQQLQELKGELPHG